MRHRPLLWLAAVYLSGTVVANLIHLSATHWLAFSFAAAIFSATFIYRRSAATAQFPLLLVTCAMLGAARYESQSKKPALLQLLKTQDRVLLEIEGTVSENPRLRVSGEKRNDSDNRTTQFVLDELMILNQRASEPAEARLLASVEGHLPELKYGDRIRCLGWLARPGTPRNPGEFDYRTFLSHRGIHLQFRLDEGRNIQILSSSNGNAVFGFLMTLNRICTKILYSTVEGKAASLLDGIILGTRDSLPEHIEEEFIATGTRHLLAISGLHVGLIVGAIVLVLYWAGVPTRVANPAAIAFAFFYAFFTGGNTPAVRAAVMVSVFLVAPLFNRRSDSLNLLGLSALIIMGADAHQPFSTGFQLSFVAVFSILLLTPELQNMFEGETTIERMTTRQKNDSVAGHLWRFVYLSLAVSAAAWIGTFPLTAYTFNRIAPLSILVNVFVYPIVCLMLSIGMLGFMVSVVVYPLGQALLLVAAYFGEWLLSLIHLAAQTPVVSRLFLPSPWLVSLILFYLWLLLFVSRGYLEFSRLKLGICAVACCIVHAVHTNFKHQEQKGSFSVTVLDVGHGGATFVELPDGTNLLYDVGSSSSSDISARTVAPFLWQRGITELDRVVISHLDSDHYSGFPSLLQRIKVKELIVTPQTFQRSTGKWLMREAAEAGAIVSSMSAGSDLAGGRKWKLQALSPPADPVESIEWSDNDLSLVLKLTLGDVSILMPADIQDSAMHYLLQHQARHLRADILLVPHHGGFAFQTAELLKAVQPSHAVFSAWSYWPNVEMLRLYKEHGATLHITGRDGPAFFQTDGGNVIYTLRLRHQ